MRIAYLSFEKPGHSGVGQKIAAQCQTWSQQGHNVHNIIFSSLPSKHSIPTLNLFLNRKVIRKALVDFKPDIIYMREIKYFPGLIRCLAKIPYIVEINSDALTELRLTNKLKYLYHKIFSVILLRNATGVCYVSHELRKQFSNKVNKHQKQIVVANGYQFDDIQGATFTVSRSSIETQKPQIIFVGSPGQIWHGLDHFEAFAAQCPEFDFHVVMPGYKSRQENIKAHGGLYGSALHELYRTMDIGMGTMAAYRKKVFEGSSLKVREYIAFGLPVIVPYYDTDLHVFTPSQGVLSLPNEPDTLCAHIKKVKKFISKWHGKRINCSHFVPVLSYKNKEESRLRFMEDCVA